jgi:triacylglycerol lipase
MRRASRLCIQLFGLTGWVGILTPASVNATADTNSHQDVVVLLHGMGRGTLSMKRIEWALVNRGYRVVNVGYPSTSYAVEHLARAYLAPALHELDLRPGERVHFVTHSLGAIVLRQQIVAEPMQNLGRVVMLGPPNRGSEIADVVKRDKFLRLFTGPSGPQLGTSAADLPRPRERVRDQGDLVDRTVSGRD